MPRKKKTPESSAPVELPPSPTVVDLPPDVTPELAEYEAEMREISPTLYALKRDDYQKYKTVYRRYMWLVAERGRILGGG